MKHYSKAAVFFALFLAVFLCFSSCAEKPQEPSDEVLSTADLGIIHEPEFGGIYIKMTIEDFNALGFNFGDSVDIVFSNGITAATTLTQDSVCSWAIPATTTSRRR